MKGLIKYSGIFGFLLPLICWSCFTKKNTDNNQHVQLAQVVKGGCFHETDKSQRATHLPHDSLFMYVQGDTLNMKVGLAANCCSNLKDSIQLNEKSITVYIEDRGNDPCKCNCYFTYNFQFKNFNRGLTNGLVKLKGYQDTEYRTILTDSIKQK